jgi:hypothetical protein
LKDRLSKDRFPNEFLLHLVIVYRILNPKLKKVYGGSQCSEYALEFLTKSEEVLLNVPLSQRASHSVTKFIDSSSQNFHISWIGDSGTCHIFKVMGEACKSMVSIMKLKGNQNTFGIRLFWCMYIILHAANMYEFCLLHTVC